MSFSNRSRSVLPFKAMQMMAAANALEEAGRRVIHLEVGQPDFSAPECVRRKALEVVQAGRMGYSNAEGLPELREAIASFYHQRFGIEIPSRRVLITAGASGALALLIPLLTDPGEGWLLPDPGYPSYRHFVSAYGCEPQALRLRAENEFQPSSCQIEQHWKSNTRALVLASPSNPAGTQIDESLARDLIEVVRHRGGHVVADEIYQGVNPDGQPLPTTLSHANDAFIVNSFSKYFGMTGWRLGWMVVPESAVDPLIRLAQNLFICPSVVAQAAAVAAFSPEAIAEADARSTELNRKRALMINGLLDIGFDVPARPEGAFYVFARLPESMPNAEVFCQRALEEVGVAVTPGTDFGEYRTERYVRLSCAQPETLLLEAIERLRVLVE